MKGGHYELNRERKNKSLIHTQIISAEHSVICVYTQTLQAKLV